MFLTKMLAFLADGFCRYFNVKNSCSGVNNIYICAFENSKYLLSSNDHMGAQKSYYSQNI